MTDMFGRTSPAAFVEGELFGAPPRLAEELARLREAAVRAEQTARLRPEDAELKRSAARARKAYLALRDHARTVSAEEVAAERAAEARAPSKPDDTRDLWDES